MPTLVRSQASDCANPALDLYTYVNGVPTDMYVVEFQIFEKVTNPLVPVQVYPTTPGTRYLVNNVALCPGGDKVDTGRVVARWTVPDTALVGIYEVRWYFKFAVAAPEQSFREEFTVLASPSASSVDGYTTIADLRAEGVTTSQASDARLQLLIARASALVDLHTGRYFGARSKTIRVDGTGARALLLNEPIVRIDAVRILDSIELDTFTPVTLGDLKIYNRHLTDNLTDPDDRDSPRIEWQIDGTRRNYEGVQRYLYGGVWPPGRKNIELVGIFGYTDPDGTATGRVPLLISHATAMLVIRELVPLADPTASAAAMTSRIRREKTRDQEVEYEAASSLGRSGAGAGRLTGDARIDSILERYKRVPILGAA